MKKIKEYSYLISIIIISSFFYSCDSDDSNPTLPASHERGELSGIKEIGLSSKENIQQILNSFQLEIPFVLSYSVKTISVNYFTVDKDGNEEEASGALFIPNDLDNLPIISIQHGTETFSNSVASVSALSSVEGISGLMLASMGYLVFVPDYLGFGTSDVNHPYLHAKSLTPCIIDFIRAGKKHIANENISLNGNLFLSGYSEGGYVTLAAQKDIEENYSNEFQLTAVAPLAGPYDLRGTSDSVFINKEYGNPIYIGYLLTAYNEIYKWNKLDEMFKEPYSNTINSLFDGSKTWNEIGAQLPNSFSDLLKDDFVNSYLSGNEQELSSAFDENTLLNWKPNTPIHFFHGDSDETVPVENAFEAMENLKANGATNIQLTIINGGTHATAGLPALIGAIEWIESYK